eukprot:9543254-Heterocapsa_arctica.AAC.1
MCTRHRAAFEGIRCHTAWPALCQKGHQRRTARGGPMHPCRRRSVGRSSWHQRPLSSAEAPGGTRSSRRRSE